MLDWTQQGLLPLYVAAFPIAAGLAPPGPENFMALSLLASFASQQLAAVAAAEPAGAAVAAAPAPAVSPKPEPLAAAAAPAVPVPVPVPVAIPVPQPIPAPAPALAAAVAAEPFVPSLRAKKVLPILAPSSKGTPVGSPGSGSPFSVGSPSTRLRVTASSFVPGGKRAASSSGGGSDAGAVPSGSGSGGGGPLAVAAAAAEAQWSTVHHKHPHLVHPGSGRPSDSGDGGGSVPPEALGAAAAALSEPGAFDVLGADGVDELSAAAPVPGRTVMRVRTFDMGGKTPAAPLREASADWKHGGAPDGAGLRAWLEAHKMLKPGGGGGGGGGAAVMWRERRGGGEAPAAVRLLEDGQALPAGVPLEVEVYNG
jgi:hypothetical protein